jgi:glycolate oxidase FAD binding subunit
MIAHSAALRADLAALVGEAHVLPATSADAIDGVQPQLVVAPGSAADLARVLRWANSAGLRVALRGGGSKLDWGNPPAGIDVVLLTRRLDRVLEHAWGDMTATVEAGCSVARLQRTLAEHGQRLALDPLWPEQATIGGVLATNDSGALRARFGTLRDLVIGMTIALPDGTLARSGCKVVKNVAGYDLPKLMTGALGTLGAIVEATFRLHPLPSATESVRITCASAAAANELILQVLDSTLVPTGVALTAGSAVSPHIDLRFEGIPAAIQDQIAKLTAISASNAPPVAIDAASWQQRERLWDAAELALIAKISVLPTQLAQLAAALERLARPLRLQWRLIAQALGAGLLRLDGANDQVLLTALSLLRAEIGGLGGSVVVLRCPAALKPRIDVWGTPGDALPLMRQVKARFDPQAILNPGRYVGGL